MDITKFEINRVLVILILGLCCQYTIAQYRVPIYVTTSQSGSKSVPIRVSTNFDIHFGYERVDTAYTSGLSGYNKLIVGRETFPIHLEDFDDFNAAVFTTDSVATIIYSGAQGAIKNEYVFQRNIAYEKYGQRTDLMQLSKNELTRSLDSLEKPWSTKLSNYPFSEIFKQDEKMYQRSYRAYVELLHQVFQTNPNGTLDDIDLNQFPKMDYSNERYYLTIPPYRALARSYLLNKLLTFESSRKARRELHKNYGYSLRYEIKKKALIMATEHHPKAGLLFDVAKPRYSAHKSENRRLYKNSRDTGKGYKVEFPEVNTVDDKAFDMQKLSGNKIYLYLYNMESPIMVSRNPSSSKNLAIWNKLVLQNSDPDTYFIALALDGMINLQSWKSLQFDSQVAGLNITTRLKDGVELQKQLGIKLLPRVVEIAADGTISDPNVYLDFLKFDSNSDRKGEVFIDR